MINSDLQKLFDMLLKTAEELLNKNAEMYPIAAMISKSGMTPLMAYWGEEHPSSQKVIDELTAVLISNAFPQGASGLGLAYDVRYAEDDRGARRDAIQVDLEHTSGDSISVIVPYSRSSNGTIKLGDPFSVAKVPQWYAANKNL